VHLAGETRMKTHNWELKM